MEFIKNYLDELKKDIETVSFEDIKKVVDVLYDAYKKNKQIFIFGNGGSASTASHFACDLSKGTLQRVYDDNERRFKVISLTDNVAILTALGNDLNYDHIFLQQLKNLVAPGDVVIAISGSGNSSNILKAVEYASKMAAVTVGLVGFDGGELKKMVDYNIHVKSDHYGRVEDVHVSLVHLICSHLTELKKREND